MAMNKLATPKNGDLRIWWIPQVPGKAFTAPVKSVKEAVNLLRVLASYDIFQLENRIKPDFCNAGGLQVWDAECPDESGDCWVEWVGSDGEMADDLIADEAQKEMIAAKVNP